MSPRHLLIASLFAAVALPAGAAERLNGCAAKRAQIEKQLEYAKEHGNHHQQAGLAKALKEVNENCSDDRLRAEREKKVLEAQHQVSVRESELRKAMDKGDAEKIDKRKTKLAKARAELREAQEQLER